MVVGAISCGIERQVKEAGRRVQVLTRYPMCRLFILAALRPEVLQRGHSAKLVCHPVVHGTLASVRQRFCWLSWSAYVTQFVLACPMCAQSKPSNRPPSGLLQPLLIPSRPWSHVALDFVKSPYPNSPHHRRLHNCSLIMFSGSMVCRSTLSLQGIRQFTSRFWEGILQTDRGLSESVFWLSPADQRAL